MRVIFMGNNRVGLEVATYLKQEDVTVVGAVLHPRKTAKFRDEITDILGLPADAVFLGSTLRRKKIFERIAELAPHIGVSILFGYILKPPFLSLFQDGVVNLHPSLLPFNRGQYPNVWSIVEKTPAGVTLHYLDEEIDTGDIIAQQEVTVSETDTGKTLYQRLEAASILLFKEYWPAISKRVAPRRAQLTGEGTYHRTSDVEMIDEIDLDRSYLARELIDILRARTFLPYHGAYFRSAHKKIYLHLELRTEEAQVPNKGTENV